MHRAFKILGVPEGASDEVVKKAYRKMAMQYHPDVNTSPNATAKFAEIQKAYDFILNQKISKVQPRVSSQDMADTLAKRFEEQKRARMRQQVREQRRREEERFMNTRAYKVALAFRKGFGWFTLLVALSFMIVPVFGFVMHMNERGFEWNRIVFMLGTVLIGGLFAYAGIYQIKKNRA